MLAVARDLQPRLKRVSSSEYAGPCPVGCASTDGFIVNPKKRVFLCRPSGAGGDAIAMVMHALNVDFMAAVEQINGQRHPGLGVGSLAEMTRRSEERAKSTEAAAHWLHESEAADAAHALEMRQAALRIWSATAPIAGSLGEQYFRSRAITRPLPEELRFLPELEHWPTRQMWPAVVGRVTGFDGAFLGVHLTFLTGEGLSNKALGKKRKLMLGSVKGGAVRLDEPDSTRFYIVAEGIESALSYMQLKGLPGCAGLSANGIASLILPRAARCVLIAADNDPNGAGARAAESARARWLAEDREVLIRKPKRSGADFNDILIEMGKS
jgi:hypothetical protein